MQQTITKPSKSFTLIFLLREKEVLLGMKKRGFATGKWNGFGGKLEKGESVNQGAIRELYEECGAIVKEEDLHFQGFMTFDMDTDLEKIFRIHIYTVNKFEGEIQETEEMLPKWFKLDEIPYDKMWKDDQYWYPLMFQQIYFECFFHFKDSDEIIDQYINNLQNQEELIQIQQKLSPDPLQN